MNLRFAASDVGPTVDGVFTGDHEDLRKEVRAFVERELRPHVSEWEAAESFPKELFARTGPLVWAGSSIHRRWGARGRTWPPTRS